MPSKVRTRYVDMDGQEKQSCEPVVRRRDDTHGEREGGCCGEQGSGRGE